MQVSIEPDPAGVRIGAPVVLFRTNIAEADTGVRNRYVVDPSGKRFLIRTWFDCAASEPFLQGFGIRDSYALVPQDARFSLDKDAYEKSDRVRVES